MKVDKIGFLHVRGTRDESLRESSDVFSHMLLPSQPHASLYVQHALRSHLEVDTRQP